MEGRGVGGLLPQLATLGCVARTSNYSSKLSHNHRIARSSLIIQRKLSMAYQCLAAALDLSWRLAIYPGPMDLPRLRKRRDEWPPVLAKCLNASALPVGTPTVINHYLLLEKGG